MVICEPRAMATWPELPARPTAPDPAPAQPGAARAGRRAAVRRYAARGRDPRASSSAARWTRRASASARSWRIHQRRASRIAYQYLRDAAEADEAVQDAFVKVFTHITSYREAWPFEVWFTRILINGCLDRRKARGRRDRWFVAGDDHERATKPRVSAAGPADAIPRHRLLARERRARIAAAIDRLDGRQRTVFMLCHYGDCTPREVSAMTGLERIDRPRPPVSRRAQAARPPGRKAVMRRARHLQDERLFDCYMAERTASRLDPPVAEHLADCDACGARYAELAAVHGRRCAPRGTPRPTRSSRADRLRAQQQQIARRIEHAGPPGARHQLPRPDRAAGPSTPRRRARRRAGSPRRPRPVCSSASRVGASYQFDWDGSPRGGRQPSPARRASRPRLARRADRRSRSRPARPTSAADDAFLSELEIALERPRTRELLAFDALTPHVSEISDDRYAIAMNPVIDRSRQSESQPVCRLSSSAKAST